MDFKYFILSSSKFLLDIPGIGDSPAGYISVTIAKSANFRESLVEIQRKVYSQFAALMQL